MDYHRKICNNVKKSLIKNAADNINDRKAIGIYLVDLCSGRGGDIFKWEHAKIDKVLAMDNHEESVKEAINRYKKVSKKIKPRITFLVKDVSVIKLSSVLKQKASIISCQFALHYFDLDKIIKEVSDNLMQGGFFIGVVPDGDVIEEILNNNTKIDNVTLERADQNSYYIGLKEKEASQRSGTDALRPIRRSGTKQYFEFRTERLKEFMVRKDNLQSIAETNGLKLCSLNNLETDWNGNHISGLYFSFVFQKV